MRRLNNWLNKHYFLWEEDNKEGVVRLYAFFITIILFVFLGITRLTGLDTMILIWAGLIVFASPVIAGLIALFKRQKWNPWYWFPIFKGGVSGGLIAMLIVYLCRNLFGC